MACYHPVPAWLPIRSQLFPMISQAQFLSLISASQGSLNSRRLFFMRCGYRPARPIFKKPKNLNGYREISVPCGRCIGCRISRCKDWSSRCWHESQQYEHNLFLTLTYAPEHLPVNGSGCPIVKVSDFQAFMKRFRQHLVRSGQESCRFFHCGEFGSLRGRPHYHALIFNSGVFPDLKFYKFSKSGEPLYMSKTITELWGKGRVIIGSVTYKSAGYVARYCLKKEYGNKDHRGPGLSEYITMSRRPGIGFTWFNKYKDQLLSIGFLNVPGKDGSYIKVPIPKYYLKILKNHLNFADEYDRFIYRRMCRACANQSEYIPERLAVKEQILLDRLRKLQRNLENEG
ncbi:replication initiator protein [Sigmofec virus UA08Rod_6051]|uniref:Replication initiator protein n=1 Tax=Sigmofec virus UA08Rod_6051 TaxID=2929449 RepID=A0A976R579_9VIRU|nr:replication initiator protein [Sigmofec virus UA08Rod_6051]